MIRPALAIVALFAIGASALGHDAASWIQGDPLYIGIDGAHCCGPQDCERAPPDAAVQNGAGWDVPSTGQRFADGQQGLYQSNDGGLWWCRRGDYRLGHPRVVCLFVPMRGT